MLTNRPTGAWLPHLGALLIFPPGAQELLTRNSSPSVDTTTTANDKRKITKFPAEVLTELEHEVVLHLRSPSFTDRYVIGKVFILTNYTYIAAINVELVSVSVSESVSELVSESVSGALSESVSGAVSESESVASVSAASVAEQDEISLIAIENFVRIVFNQVNRKSILRAIVENPLALQIYSYYLASDEIGSYDLIHCSNSSVSVRNVDASSFTKVNFDSVKIQTSLTISLKTNGTIHSELYSLACASIRKFARSLFFFKWRELEWLKIDIFLRGLGKLPQTTLPELEVAASSVELMTKPTASINFINCSDQYCHDASKMYLESEPPLSTEPVMSETQASPCVALNTTTSSTTDEAIASCDQLEVAALLSSDRWLVSLICSAETLPIGITVSKVCNRPPGTGIFDHYPLVYVNNHFAHKCGHRHREDVMGQGFRFMHNNCTIISDKGQQNMDKISCALSMCKSVGVVFTRVGPDGRPFFSIVGVKPITDEHLKYRYVIGIHMNLPITDDMNHSLALVKILIAILPSVIRYH
eukprot:gene4847-9655_t